MNPGFRSEAEQARSAAAHRAADLLRQGHQVSLEKPDDDLKVLFYGGSFNPPHIGHVITVYHATRMLKPDLTLVVPTFQHPYAKPLEDFEQRLHMCELAMSGIPNLEVSRIEQELGGVSVTLRTIQTLKQDHPNWEITMLMGSDVAQDFSSWPEFGELSTLVSVFSMGRMGFHQSAETPVVPEVSSTVIRHLIRNGLPDQVVDLLYPEVLEYIKAEGLYR